MRRERPTTSVKELKPETFDLDKVAGGYGYGGYGGWGGWGGGYSSGGWGGWGGYGGGGWGGYMPGGGLWSW